MTQLNDLGPGAMRLAGLISIGRPRPIALLGIAGRGKPWLAGVVANGCGLTCEWLDARALGRCSLPEVRRRLRARRGDCLIVNYIDAASEPLLRCFEAEAVRRIVIGCGPALAGDPRGWDRVEAGLQWQARFAAAERVAGGGQRRSLE